MRRGSLGIRGHKVRDKSDSIEERDAAVERLREFLGFSYVTGNQVAQRIGLMIRPFIRGFRGKVNRGLLLLRGSSRF